MSKGMRSGGFFDAAEPNARRANLDLLAHTVDHGANALEIGVPAATRGVIRVAYDVPVAGAFAANFTLQCHDSPTSSISKDRKQEP